MKKLKNILMTIVFIVAIMLVSMIASVSAKAAVPEIAIDYSGTEWGFFKEDGLTQFGMLSPQTGSYIGLAGDDVIIHVVPSNKKTYGWIHYGLKTDEELTKDVTFNADGTIDIILPTSYCGYGIPIAPIKKTDGGTSKDQYYLCIPKTEYIPVWDKFTITNNTSMFNLVDAYYGSTESILYFTLSGSGYHYLFEGDYDKASENGDNPDNWIRGCQNSEGKWAFKMKLNNDETYVPLVAISNSYYTKYTEGKNSLERAFYPRQLTLDFDDKTIVSDDYHETIDISIDNQASMFSTDSATLTTIGGPNSNGYNIILDLFMGSDKLDAVFVGEKDDAVADGAEIIEVVDGNHFIITVEKINTPGDPATITSYLDDALIFSFKSKKNQNWNEKKVTISKKNKIIVFENPGADYSEVDMAIESIPEDIENYKEETVAVLDEVINSINRNYNFKHQDLVDAMAATIYDAIARLELKDEVVAARTQALVDKAKESYATSEEKRAAINEARAAYAAMTPEQKALIEDPTEVLNAEEEKAGDQEAVEKVAASVEEAKKDYPTAKEKQAAIDAAKKAYEKLTDDQKALMEDPKEALEAEQKKADAQKAEEDKKAAEEEAAKNKAAEVPVGTQATVGDFVFKVTSKTTAALVKPTKKTLTKVTIPTAVTIQNQSFNVTEIQANAFKKNVKMKALNIGANVTTIGASAFEGCKKITKITIPAAVTTIGNKAFMGCKKATKLVIKGTAIKSFGKKSFAKTGIKKLTAPKKKKAAFKKKLIKAGLKKTVK